MVKKEYSLNSVVRMRKKHPCGGEFWQVLRLGADIRLKCQKCGHMVMMPRSTFEKNLVEVLENME